MKSDVPLVKSESMLRWLILVLACLMLVGSYYCYDIPAALKTQIDDYMGDPSDYEVKFGLLYTLYAAPNVRHVCFEFFVTKDSFVIFRSFCLSLEDIWLIDLEYAFVCLFLLL